MMSDTNRQGLKQGMTQSQELRYFSSTDNKKPERLSSGFLTIWWPGAESNHRHKDFQSSALPTELPGHFLTLRRLSATLPALRAAHYTCILKNSNSKYKQF
jgi:hypothetical protein